MPTDLKREVGLVSLFNCAPVSCRRSNMLSKHEVPHHFAMMFVNGACAEKRDEIRRREDLVERQLVHCEQTGGHSGE